MHSQPPPVQMFLNIRLPVVRFARPLFPDPRTRPQAWRVHPKTGYSSVRALLRRSGNATDPAVPSAAKA